MFDSVWNVRSIVNFFLMREGMPHRDCARSERLGYNRGATTGGWKK